MRSLCAAAIGLSIALSAAACSDSGTNSVASGEPEGQPDAEPEAGADASGGPGDEDVEPSGPEPDAEPSGAEPDAEPSGAEPDVPEPECNNDGECGHLEEGDCTRAICNPDSGTCELAPVAALTACDDGDPCTTDSACSGEGECSSGIALDCDDGDLCTDDACAVGDCTHTANTASCDDGNACTEGDACSEGTCAGSETDACGCTFDEDCADLDDGDPCNGSLVCSEGQCIVGPDTLVVCDSSQDTACSKNKCDSATGACAMVSTEDGAACSDGNPCTTGDTCAAGTCEGDQASSCTCDTADDCEPYDDGDACNGIFECSEGSCVIAAGSVADCDTSGDGDCATTTCNPISGQCETSTAADGTGCDDGDACTAKDACSGGACAGTPTSCDDGDPCTEDACDASEGCASTPVDCDDGDACTADSCDPADGSCSVEVTECNDEQLCTSDTCDPETGECVFAPTNCDDGDGCTDDVCDSATGTCQHQPVICDDEDSCSEDFCDPGTAKCVNLDVECDDDDPCTVDACDPGSGDCVHAPTDCEDGDACTVHDCQATVGCVQAPLLCDDDDLCTIDDCDPAQGCLHTPTEGCEQHPCCEASNDGCEDPEVEDCVCGLDPFCCNVSWEDVCIQTAIEECGLECEAPVIGDCGDGVCDELSEGQETCATCPSDCGPCEGECCEANDSIGCDDKKVTSCVCGAEPYCCFIEWDIYCADAAFEECGLDSCEPTCGDDACVFGEDCESCEIDCGSCSLCGDGFCVGDEDCESCAEDCGTCAEPGDCCLASGAAGCLDPTCEAIVCDADSFCCEIGWDGSCAEDAQAVCACGITPESSCCEPSFGLGCDDPSCQALICGDDPFCCNAAWDEACVDKALASCAVCGASPTPCCSEHEGTGCDDPGCTYVVCEDDAFCCETAWDPTCAATASDLCPDCGGQWPSDCCVPGDGGTGCDDLDCQFAVCSTDDFCCNEAWDAECATLAGELCAGCGGTPPSTCCLETFDQGCDDTDCEVAVCFTDDICCELFWDALCVLEAEAVCGVCGGSPAGICCLGNDESPGCDDEDCEAIVCTFDDLCCDVLWDDECAGVALDACEVCGGETPADCCLGSESTGCEDLECEDLICPDDGFCCAIGWDELCVAKAHQLCPICGGTPPPDCCGPKAGAGCSDEGCAGQVCEEDVFCCDFSWDQTCGTLALELCEVCGATPPEPGSCCEAQEEGSCNDPFCAGMICDEAPECCSIQWDQLCADAANFFCEGCDGILPSGPCCTPDPESAPGCEQIYCSYLVCAEDPDCCETLWDGLCAAAALEVCEACGAAGSGDCCEPNTTPGCELEDCNLAVCGDDPFCCDTGWDQDCADAANGVCDICL